MRSASFYFERALLSVKTRDYEAASRDLVEAIKLDPELIEAWVVRGNICIAQGRPFDGLLHYDRALQIKPEAADLWNNRGLAFTDIGSWANAEVSFRESIKRRDAVEPRMNLGNLYAGMMRLADAATEYRHAIEFEPGNYEAHLNLGVTLLGLGLWEEGFREYYARHRGTVYPSQWQRDYVPWQGEDLDCKSILLYPEQGLGDEILFAQSYFWLRRRYPGARITLASRTPLRPVLSSLQGYGNHDYACSTIDVVGLLGLTPLSLPAFEPYASVPLSYARKWRGSLPVGTKIGLCWESGQRPLQPDTAATSANKSIPLAMFGDILRTPGVTFVSLQKEHRDQALARDFGLFDPMGNVYDFGDTAAVIGELDLVISVDTSVAHLAGAMGKPVWNLVRFAGYWPWLSPAAAGDDRLSIWYPSMTLYRQPALFDWATPLRDVKTDLDVFLVQGEKAA